LTEHIQWYGSRSHHPVGVQVALFDGSVWFVSEKINCASDGPWPLSFFMNYGQKKWLLD
jgi:hypothetical protein